MQTFAPHATEAAAGWLWDAHLRASQMDGQQLTESSLLPDKQWPRTLKNTAGQSSRPEFPMSKGFPGNCSYTHCLHKGQSITQEKLVESRFETTPNNPHEKERGIFTRGKDLDKHRATIKTPRSAGKPSDAAQSIAADDTWGTGQNKGGQVRLRVTPQHFSPLGTAFREVQVHFLSKSFTIQALDREGYAWTAYSGTLPGCIDTDRCKFRIKPNGEDVVISLRKADRDGSWQRLERLELTRPYCLPDKARAA